MHRLVAHFLTLLFVIGLTSAALADAAGSAQGVDPDAEARGGETRTLVVGSDIFIGDRIVTGPEGQVQILFSDRTKLVVGPRSALLIEDYLIREDGSAGKMVLDALGGSFRFITGRAPKDRYQINTPGGTISVRGTAFQLWVGAAVYMLVEHGIACSGDECADNVCEIMKIAGSDTQVLGAPGDMSREDRAEMKDFFIYSGDESSLMGPYRQPVGRQCFNTNDPGGGPPSTIEQGPDNEIPQDGCCDSIGALMLAPPEAILPDEFEPARIMLAGCICSPG